MTFAFASWLRKRMSSKGAKSPVNKRSNFRKLAFDVLEDRVVPSVTAVADSYSVLHDQVLIATADSSNGVNCPPS